MGRSSLFARIQQFSSSVYGPIHAAGLAFLQGPDGNYWGHNAIIRVHAFMQHCGLPRLPGKPPFGGEIMSHDFIEAALLRRAGWDVWMAPDIGGSFEEPPPTLLDYLIRDRRWCQGNLQHLRIVFAQGLALPSRLHLAMGIMSYVSSPLWLLLLVVSVDRHDERQGAAAGSYIGLHPSLPLLVSHAAELVILVLATLVLLYGPKLLAVIAVLESPDATRAHGGAGAVLWSALVGSGVLHLDGADRDAAAQLVCVQHPDGHGHGLECADPRRPRLAAGHGGAQIRAPYRDRPGRHLSCCCVMRPTVSTGSCRLLAGLWLAIPLVVFSSSPLLGMVARARSGCSWCPAKRGAPRCWAAPMPWPAATKRCRIRPRNWCWTMRGCATCIWRCWPGAPLPAGDPLAAVEPARACGAARHRRLQPRGLGAAAVGFRRPEGPGTSP